MKPLFRLTIAASLLLGASTAFAAHDTPVGKWKQVDDVSGKVKSIIEITDTNGQLQGKIVQLLNVSPEDIAREGAHPVCVKCDDERKDKPIEGMTIMWGVSKDDDVWDGGKILDPKNGKIYKVKLTLTDGGTKLDVHGYIGFSLLGRSQTWQREE
ncbi:DUF2147 domain-containing protein [Rhodanobacter sp. L36]|uniref:DUF2147 domain-containing protein n=1 Tax=Rhodanobacter sp. L36 TaxID=1747221 RepID=UPI00131C4374|nr:DUF2147 domain-containing protein [Rhodanobacter sp. L36]